MFDTVCTYPLRSDLFSLAVHPSEPLVALGLSSGHVQINRLPGIAVDTSSKPALNTVATQWRTHRHKGSCRSLCFDPSGDLLYSAGTDGIVKTAAVENGVVISKIAVPLLDREDLDAPTLIHALSTQTLLLATDSSALHLYDVRVSPKGPSSTGESLRPVQTFRPHSDYVTSISTLPAVSSTAVPTQWLSTGGTTVAITDVRRGILTQSEDQGEELMSSTVLNNDKALVGSEEGVLRIWQVGSWDDNETKINISGGLKRSAEVMSAIPDQNLVAVGMDDGMIRFLGVNGKNGQLVEETDIMHDEIEGVADIAFLSDGRMVSGGGTVVKIWEERAKDDESEDGVDDAAPVNGKNGHTLQENESESDEDSEDEDEPKRRKKRRKKNKGKKNTNGPTVIRFKGLD